MKEEYSKQILESEVHLTNYLSKVCGDADLARDLFQTLFIRVHDKLSKGKFQEGTNFKGWVFTMAKNMVTDMFRYRGKYVIIGEVNHLSGGTEGNIAEFIWDNVNATAADETADRLVIAEDVEYEKQLYSTKIKAAKSHLDPLQYLVLTLRSNDYSFKEIAEITGKSINTSLGQMRYSKMNFEKQFNEKRIREKRRKRFKEGRAGTFDYEKLLLKLPPYQYFVIKMKPYCKTFEEIALLEGVPTSTVYYRFLWAKKNLKKMVKSEEDYDKIINYIDSLNTNTGGKNWHKNYIKDGRKEEYAVQ